jgi:uncharacterized protein YkwD
MGRLQQFIKVILLGWFLALMLSFSPAFGGTRDTLSASADQQQEAAQSTVFMPVVIDTGPGGAPINQPEWLQQLNGYRAQAKLPRLTLNSSWGDGGWNHSRYMVKNNEIAHQEDKNNRWYTPEGDQAARSSNLLGSTSITLPDKTAIGLWMQGPFHALGILDPRLKQVGFGSFREQDGGVQMGAALDVLRGRGDIPAEVQYPVAWPADGASTTLNSYTGGEYPDPVSACPGYTKPVGLPIILQIGSGDRTPKLGAHSFRQGGSQLDHCVFTETSYTNPDSAAQDLGRLLMGARDAIVLIPRSPLVPGRTYTVSITADGRTYNWSFQVSTTLDLTPDSLEETLGEYFLD